MSHLDDSKSPPIGKKRVTTSRFLHPQNSSRFANDLPDSNRKFCPGVVWELSAKAMRDLWLLFPYEHLGSKSSEVAVDFPDRPYDNRIGEMHSCFFRHVIYFFLETFRITR